MSKKIYYVGLTLFVDEEIYSSPNEWAWEDLLDMSFEDVILEEFREVEEA